MIASVFLLRVPEAWPCVGQKPRHPICVQLHPPSHRVFVGFSFSGHYEPYLILLGCRRSGFFH